jgi:hypothetical protein
MMVKGRASVTRRDAGRQWGWGVEASRWSTESVVRLGPDNVLRISCAADQSRGRIAPAIRRCQLNALVVPRSCARVSCAMRGER